LEQNVRKVNTVALITAACLLGDSMLYVVLPTHWEEFGLTSLWQVGILLSVNRFVRLPLSPVIGWLYRSMSKRSGILLAVTLAVLTTAGYGFAEGLWPLLLRSLWGVAWTFLRASQGEAAVRNLMSGLCSSIFNHDKSGVNLLDRVVLRGHHLLCVHGFQGMGYSPEFIEKMGEIVKRIRDPEQDFPIQVVRGFDDTCLVCPNKGSERCEASPDSEEHVQLLDRNVLRHLDLQEGEVYLKSELVERTRQKVEPDDLARLCAGCSWYPYGVCREGIARLKQQDRG
jgi:hypothetical protein